MTHQVPKLKCFSSQRMKTSDALIMFVWSTILLPTKVRLILDLSRQSHVILFKVYLTHHWDQECASFDRPITQVYMEVITYQCLKQFCCLTNFWYRKLAPTHIYMHQFRYDEILQPEFLMNHFTPSGHEDVLLYFWFPALAQECFCLLHPCINRRWRP